MRTDRIGDVLMNLPAIRLLRQTFPKAWIMLMADESVAPLLNGHSDIDEIMPVSSKQIKKSLRYRLNLTKKIKQIQCDLGLVSNPDKNLHAMLYFAKVPVRVGYHRKWSFFLTDKVSPDKACQNITHEIDKNIKLVKRVSDKNWDGSLTLPVDMGAAREVEERLGKEFLSSERLIVIHPGTSDPKKRWPEIYFAQLCDEIQSDQSLKVLLIGGLEEAESSKRVMDKMKTKVSNWTGVLNLKELSALFHHPKVKLALSVDSGPAHIAWIAGTPTVILYAKNTTGSDPRRWGPRDKKSEVIFKPMSEITVEEVYEAARKVLQLR